MAAYRPYLRAVAEQAVPAHLRARMDGSDLVQESLLRATKQIAQFSGQTDAEFVAWIKQILHHLIVDWVRHHAADKRDIRRDGPAEAGLAAHIAQSPSGTLAKKEELQRVTAAVQKLSKDQQAVVQWRSEGLSFEDIGLRLDRSSDAARMVWGRAIGRLIKMLENHE